jgi:protein TonB
MVMLGERPLTVRPHRRFSAFAASIALHALACVLLAIVRGPKVLPIRIPKPTVLLVQKPRVRVAIQAPGQAGQQGTPLTYDRRAKARALAAAEKAHVMQSAASFSKTMIANVGFQGFYKYDFAYHTSGELPVVTAAELPPRFEAYVIIEITIGTDGRVLDAHMKNDMVTPQIRERLLAAVRGWTYVPAKRDGIPIPSQEDVIIHIPS